MYDISNKSGTATSCSVTMMMVVLNKGVSHKIPSKSDNKLRFKNFRF